MTPVDEKAPLAVQITLPPDDRCDPDLAPTLPPLPRSNPAFSRTLPPEEPANEGLVQIQSSALSLSQRGGFPVANWERYDFLMLLGQGGMGAVYQARDKRLNRTVALKFIRSGDPNMIMRFMQEARTQARIDHPHVCKVYEVGEVEGQAYIAMQFVDGKSLEDVSSSLPLTEKIVIMKKVAEAMHEAHRLGIIHRDLKPSNIMLEPDEDGRLNPLVMDFGLARESGEGHGLTETGAVMGTPAYMAPEQARGETRSIDRRCDVYSLGATLYDLVVGAPPFDAESIVDILLKVVNEDAPPLHTRIASIPPDLDTIVMKCLNKDPNQRYDSAKALAEDLERYLNGEPILGRRMSLAARLRRRAKRNRTLIAVSVLSLFVVLSLSIGALQEYVTNRRERQHLEAQARIEQQLAQHLGQEITKVDWVLRSARQLPLHDLTREKIIVRERMAQLQSELKTYGEISRGLGHYVLGRGHMALHEYPQALTELREGMRYGIKSPDIHYALGIVLGKHFEQAMYEARLSGGGDWAKKQLKEIEPTYLLPAVESLQRSRSAELDSPSYLEGLIAYYQRDYAGALNHVEVALRKTPWLYDAIKLAGDIQLEQALQARDSGRYEEAEKAFAASAKSYQEAAAIGQSDAEIYAGLAETSVRQIETAMQRGQPVEAAYAAAVSASDKLLIAEPLSIAGPLKKAYAAMMTMGVSGAGLSSEKQVRLCLESAADVLAKQPGHPYASDVAAGCNAFAADRARTKGQDPEPLLRKALGLLEPTVQTYPYFLWGINDLGNTYQILGAYLQQQGRPEAKEVLQKSIERFTAAATLDSTYSFSSPNALGSLTSLISEARSEQELQATLSQADHWLAKCKLINSQLQLCFINYFQVYARAAWRTYLSGADPQPRLKQALSNLAEASKLGGSALDAEQHAALTHLTDAANRARKSQDPAPGLNEMEGALVRCFAIAQQDAMCRTLAAQAEWIRSDWLAANHRPTIPSLKIALRKAILATESPEPYPDAWQVLAETYLRLAREEKPFAAIRDQYVELGLSSTAKVFSINPNHALGRATQGCLTLTRAQAQRSPESRRTLARAAAESLDRALNSDPFLRHQYAHFLDLAKSLAENPESEPISVSSHAAPGWR